MPGEYGGEYGPGLGTGIANPPRFSGEPLADMTRAKLMQLLLKAGDGVESGDPVQSGLESHCSPAGFWAFWANAQSLS